MKITAQQFAAYRATAQHRAEQTRIAARQRRNIAQQVAQQAATLLKTKFSATRVMLFGSTRQPDHFSATSDVDIAAWGIDGRDYFLAVAYLQDISPDFKVDLIRMEDCPPKLRGAILAEGELL